MIILTQVIIVLFVVAVAAVTLSNRKSHSGKAWKKIALVLLAVVMIITALLPDILTGIANALGIGRGADLLLYATVLAFILYVLNGYLHQQDQRDALYRLARKVSIIEANNRYGIKTKD